MRHILNCSPFGARAHARAWPATTSKIMYDFSKPVQCTDIIAMSIYYCKVGIISVNFIISFVLDKRIFSMNLFLKSCSFTRFKRLMYKILSGALGIALNSIFVTLYNSVLDFILLSYRAQNKPFIHGGREKNKHYRLLIVK